MMQPLNVALIAILLAPFAAADVKFTSPKAGATLAGGTSITVSWEESNEAPLLSELTSFQLFLCAGGNEKGTYVDLFPFTPTGVFTGGKSATNSIQVSLGASTPENAYFFRISSTGPGGSVTNFSPRFSLSGMGGSFTPDIQKALNSVDGTDGPATDAQVAAAPINIVPGEEQFDVAFGDQTGNVRYAPMMKVPPTKVTKKDKTPLYPTSDYVIAKTFLPIATIQTTITQSQTFKVSSRENTAAPAANPTDDMERFLARWKD